MAETSTIEWTDATWNPVTGCSVISPGCTNCYAMRLAGTRLQHHPSRAGLTAPSKAGPVWNGLVRLNEDWLTQPLRWKRPRRIFVCAHGDLFHEAVPDAWIDQVFAVMAAASQHAFQVLTKRAARMRAYLTAAPFGRWADLAVGPMAASISVDKAGALPNVWLGVSAEDQLRLEERLPDLLDTPAAIRFVSAEPLLGELEIEDAVHIWTQRHLRRGPTGSKDTRGRLDWVIAGGESGPGARPMHPDWARKLRDDCAAADVPFFFKQWGEWGPEHSFGGRILKFMRPGGDLGGFFEHGCQVMERRGKKLAGRRLDDVEHNAMPEAG